MILRANPNLANLFVAKELVTRQENVAAEPSTPKTPLSVCTTFAIQLRVCLMAIFYKWRQNLSAKSSWKRTDVFRSLSDRKWNWKQWIMGPRTRSSLPFPVLPRKRCYLRIIPILYREMKPQLLINKSDNPLRVGNFHKCHKCYFGRNASLMGLWLRDSKAQQVSFYQITSRLRAIANSYISSGAWKCNLFSISAELDAYLGLQPRTTFL